METPTAEAPPLDPALPPMPEGLAPLERPDQEDSGYEDYYGNFESENWFFPDHKQYITFQPMNEGARSMFQKATNRDVTVVRQTGDAKLRVDPATERHILITSSVIGWNLMRRDATGKWKSVTFSKGSPGAELEKWLQVANPKLVDDLEFAIRKANPWLQADMSVEEIDKEMERLTELREQVEKRERGEDSSSDR